MCYEQAEAVRKEILARPLEIANSSVGKLQIALKRSRAIETVAELQTGNTQSRGGLLSADAIDQANDLLKILNGK